MGVEPGQQPLAGVPEQWQRRLCFIGQPVCRAGRANGSPIKSVYVYSRAEWTALVVRKDSPLQSVAELKGKKIAATKGTDPYLFTLRALQKAGLKRMMSSCCTCSIPMGVQPSRRVT